MPLRLVTNSMTLNDLEPTKGVLFASKKQCFQLSHRAEARCYVGVAYTSCTAVYGVARNFVYGGRPERSSSGVWEGGPSPAD